MGENWPSIEHETLPWTIDPELRDAMPKSRRRKIGQTYEASIPVTISDCDLLLPQATIERLSEVTALLARFDEQQRNRGYDLPALLLRSESSASSQIENLTSSARNVALAELSDKAPSNAQLIVGNLQAMRQALEAEDELDLPGILEIHRTLINRNGATFGGSLRTEQVWVGGNAYSPHGALYVPPAHERVPACMEDLVAFTQRRDLHPIAKAAIAHAQMETIHPFIDGNGRTGRVLIHKLLRDEGVLEQVMLPVSAGLLHNIDAYMDSITRYQQGDPTAVIDQLADALELAVVIGARTAGKMDEVIAGWESDIAERKGSSIHRLPLVLVEQPVVDSAYLSRALGITTRAATSLIAKACEYGILRPMGNRMRGEFYQADQVIDVLEEISDVQGIRRVLAGTGA